MNEVVQVSSTEEYFAEDRDIVYCKHGTYIGYPGGPDYICGACENGHDTLYQGTKFILSYRIWYPEEELWGLWTEINTAYSEKGKAKFQPFLDLYASYSETHTIETRVTEETYRYWGNDDTTD